MLDAVIRWSLRNRFVVLLVTAGLVVTGFLSLHALPIDAFPDTTPVQVQINTVAPALAPEEVERQITFPVEQAISGLPGLQQLRSISKFGLSQVVVTFEDGTDIYFARQLVNERLRVVELACRHRAAADGAGRHRAGRGLPLRRHRQGRQIARRAAHDPRLGHQAADADRAGRRPRSTPGAATRSSTRSASIRDRLIKYGLTSTRWSRPSKTNNRNVGGGNIRQSRPDAAGPRPRPDSQRRADREHRRHRQGRRADPRRRRGRRGDRPRNPPRGRHRRRQGRSRARPGLHAHGREQPRSHLDHERQARRDQADASRRTSRSRPSTTARNWSTTSSTRCARTCSRAACWSSPCCSSSWATCGPA